MGGAPKGQTLADMKLIYTGEHIRKPHVRVTRGRKVVAAPVAETRGRAVLIETDGESAGVYQPRLKSCRARSICDVEGMTVDRTKIRWNGWGWTAHQDDLAGREDVWAWLAGELGMPALLATPARPARKHHPARFAVEGWRSRAVRGA